MPGFRGAVGVAAPLLLMSYMSLDIISRLSLFQKWVNYSILTCQLGTFGGWACLIEMGETALAATDKRDQGTSRQKYSGARQKISPKGTKQKGLQTVRLQINSLILFSRQCFDLQDLPQASVKEKTDISCRKETCFLLISVDSYTFAEPIGQDVAARGIK